MKFIKLEMEIRQFIRDEKKRPIGVLIAGIVPDSKKVVIGHSLVHPMDMKNYDKEIGVANAITDALLSTENPIVLPKRMKEHRATIGNFYARVATYYPSSELQINYRKVHVFNPTKDSKKETVTT